MEPSAIDPSTGGAPASSGAAADASEADAKASAPAVAAAPVSTGDAAATAGAAAAQAPKAPVEVEPATLDARWPFMATGLSALLLFCAFHPVAQGDLAWFALVPWLVVAAITGGRTALVMSYCTTALYHLVGLSWIGLVSPAGWLVTAFLEGFYGIALALIPLWIRRRTGLPLVLALPVVGAALELARGNTPVIRFPWLLLGQSQAGHDNLAQVADLTSIYGLTFLVLVVNGGLIDAALLLRARWLQEREPDAADKRTLGLVLVLPLVLVAGAWLYGARRREAVRAALVDGPLVLVIQPDYPQTLKDEPELAENVAEGNLALTARALDRRRRTDGAAPLDLIVWSETMWPWPIPDDTRPGGRDAWSAWLARIRPADAAVIASYTRRLFEVANRSGAVLIVGAVDWPDRLAGRKAGSPGSQKPHNSVYAIAPDRGVVARYDKINLVPASEYIPGEGTTLFGWVPKLVQSFIPEGFHFLSFEPGAGPVLVPVPTRGAASDAPVHAAAIDICFEVSFPELLRRSVAEGASFHVCPANDGWFVRGGIGDGQETAELGLARDHAKLRAIEGRRPMVRCVNRGVSLLVDPLGEVALDDQVYAIRDGRREVVGIDGHFVARIRTTTLETFYTRFGDLFAWGCVAGSIALVALARRGQRLLPSVEQGGVLPTPPTGPLAPSEA